jgi:hypothetical protein
MDNLNLTSQEEDELLLIFARYSLELKSEIANTDSMDFCADFRIS